MNFGSHTTIPDNLVVHCVKKALFTTTSKIIDRLWTVTESRRNQLSIKIKESDKYCSVIST